MSVKVKYAEDKDISVGGASSASVYAPSNVDSGPSFPPYGTVLGTNYSVDYLYSGTSIYGNTYYSQVCDVDSVADGFGGSFYDWSNARNILNKATGEFIASIEGQWTGNTSIETGDHVLILYGMYTISTGYRSYANFYWDGSGGYTYVPDTGSTWSFWTSGTYTGHYRNETYNHSPDGGYTYWATGIYDTYSAYHDGGASYYEMQTATGSGSYYANGTEISNTLRFNVGNIQTEVPSGSGMYWDTGKYYENTYYWDGSGTSYQAASPDSPVGSYHSYGDFITNDGSYDYFWDGSGGYYQV